MRNKAAWLELQLTLHFTEDQANGNDSEMQLVEDDCVKCSQLRKMLDESLQLPLVHVVFISCLVGGAFSPRLEDFIFDTHLPLIDPH